jgi:Tfp pilus assembly protein PilO
MNRKTKKKLTRYQKTAIGIWGAALILFGAGFFLCYLPQHELVAQVQHRFEDSNRQAAVARQASSAEARQQVQQQAERAIEQLETFAICSDRVSGLVFEIGRMADSLQLQGYSSKHLESPNRMEKPTEPSLLSEAWLFVEFSGSYEQFARFVNLLERNRPAIFVEKVTVTRGAGGSENCRFQMELSIVTMTDLSAAALKAE